MVHESHCLRLYMCLLKFIGSPQTPPFTVISTSSKGPNEVQQCKGTTTTTYQGLQHRGLLKSNPGLIPLPHPIFRRPLFALGPPQKVVTVSLALQYHGFGYGPCYFPRHRNRLCEIVYNIYHIYYTTHANSVPSTELLQCRTLICPRDYRGAYAGVIWTQMVLVFYSYTYPVSEYNWIGPLTT